jgi:hypothetical protein
VEAKDEVVVRMFAEVNFYALSAVRTHSHFALIAISPVQMSCESQLISVNKCISG